MSRETTNTNFELPKKGAANLYVESITKKVAASGVIYYRLSVTPEDGGQPFSILYFKNQMAELLRVLGAKEIKKGEFDWDTAEMSGKWITAEVEYETGKDEVERAKLVNIKPYVVPNTAEPVDGFASADGTPEEEETPNL